MDDTVNAAARVAVFAAGLLWLAGAQAQVLVDPTRPPPEAMLAAPGTKPVPGAGAASRLQSILISGRDGGRRVAVVDGETVREGDRIGGAVVLRIRETEVVLRRGRETEVLKLFPAAGNSAGEGTK